MLPMKKVIGLFACLSLWANANAQIITEQEALAKALQSYPSIRLAEQATRQRAALERTAFNPQQTQVTLETPTDVGVGVEVQQQFEFPTVYGKRAKWLKSQTRLATEATALSTRELTQQVRLAYLEAQTAAAQLQFLERQDSLWQDIAASSRRLFEAGQINRADLLFAESKAGQVSNSLLQSRADAANALAALAVFINEPIAQVADLQKLPLIAKDAETPFYFEPYFAQKQQVAASEIALRKSERLPGLLLGYSYVTELETQFRSRLRAGIMLPLFQGQYKGEIEAAEIALESAQTEATLQNQQARAMRIQLLQTLRQTEQSLNWLEQTGLPQVEELIGTSRRLYEGGEYDYVLMLRNIADALALQTQYLQTLQRHNEAVIQLEFLSAF